ncbi:MAG TPA: glycosyltransferase family 4 protein, partial [Gemmataceae bacterium]|nr:glycosyltransferase family 4 protein [Gemmataceae bacterium]
AYFEIRMNIAHFVQRYPPALGGSEAYFARLSRYLAANGNHVTVFTTAAKDLEAFWSRQGVCLPSGVQVEDGVEVRRYELARWPGRRWALKALSLLPHRLWQCLTLPCNPIAWQMWTDTRNSTQTFDVVHATAFPYAWPIACGLRLARRHKIPFLLTPFLHLGDPENEKDRTRAGYTHPALLSLIRAADRVFVQTELERLELLRHGIHQDKLILLGMGVNPAECTGGDRETARQRWGAQKGEVVIGHLANQSREKGTVDLLQAAERLWKQRTRFRLVLAGPEMANFRSFCNSWRPSGPVTRLGEIDDRQKRDFFAGIDLFALPSRSDSFGLVLLEAWANGIPNVAYRAGGVAEVIHHEQDGLLVRCGNIDELATALAHLIDDVSWRRSLGDCGRDRVAREFRWEDKLSRVWQAYQEVVDHKKPEPKRALVI